MSDVDFTPAVRIAAHALFAHDGPVLASAIAARTGGSELGIPNVVAGVRAAIRGTGAEIVKSRVAGDLAYELIAPDRPAISRLIGAPPDARDRAGSFRGFTGNRGTVLRVLVEAGGEPVPIDDLVRTLYGAPTRRHRLALKATVQDLRDALVKRPGEGAIFSRGAIDTLAYAWHPTTALPGEALRSVESKPQRVEGVTLHPIGCTSWRYHPATQSRPYGVQVMRLRGETFDRVLTGLEQTTDPLATPYTARAGTWPPASDEREAA